MRLKVCNGLTFPLLSDITRDVIKQYDVVFNDLAGVKGFTVAKRAVFVIDRQGVIQLSHSGVGRYEDTEKVIQKLLAKK